MPRLISILLATLAAALTVAACGGGDPGGVREQPAVVERERPAPSSAAANAQAAQTEPSNDLAGALEASRRRSEPGETTTIVTLTADPAGPPSAVIRGAGDGFGRMRLRPQPYACAIRVEQHRSDASAGRFRVTFTNVAGADTQQVVDVTGPEWFTEVSIPAFDAEQIRESTVNVESDAADAEWTVVCRRLSA